ncbi:MAG: hypothetical protein IT163_03235 [Bryobacterales bacterium]|nr:hypothetical protein [Bryobacterales bacterium]
MDKSHSGGRTPVDCRLTNLTGFAARARILTRPRCVEAGNFGDYGPVGAGVHEFRGMTGPGLRVYFGFDGPTLVVLSGGGGKATQRAGILRVPGLRLAVEDAPPAPPGRELPLLAARRH